MKKILLSLLLIVLITNAYTIEIQEYLYTNDTAGLTPIIASTPRVILISYDDGNTLLHIAVKTKTCTLKTMEFLINMSSNMNAQNNQGNTPLHLCVGLQDADRVRLLCTRFAKPDIKNLEGDTPLLAALKQNDYITAEALVNNKANVNIADKIGNTPLFYAQDAKFAQLLLDKGANVNITNKQGMTLLDYVIIKHYPSDVIELLLADKNRKEMKNGNGDLPIHTAAIYGYDDIINLLIKYNADINAKGDINDRTPLHYAINNNQIKTVKHLIEKNADVTVVNKLGRTLMHVAAAKCNEQILSLLLEKGLKVDAADITKMTPLHLAANAGNTDAVKFLIKYGANIENLDNKNRNPIFYAVMCKNLDTVKTLIDSKSICDLLDSDGNNLLFYADNVKIVQMLLDNGVKVNVVNKEGLNLVDYYIKKRYTPEVIEMLIMNKDWKGDKNTKGNALIHTAAFYGNNKAIDLLLKHKVDINAKSGIIEMPPVYFAITGKNEETLNYLIKNKADITMKDKQGRSLLHIAAEKGDEKAVALLLKNGFKIDETDPNGMTSLHIAAFARNVSVVQFLLKNGANLEIKDIKGRTPIFYAVLGQSVDTATVLLDNKANIAIKDSEGLTPLDYSLKMRMLNMSDLLTVKK